MDLKEKLIPIVGEAWVDDRPETLAAHARDHSLMSPRGTAEAVVHPADAAQVQAIVALANDTRTPLIPVSSRMHFHGSTLPKMGGVVVDLGRMNRILDIDLPDRLVRIEPGVTWQQVQEALAETGHRMIMPLLPPAASSVVTSLLEREVPTNPRYEYGEPMTSNEVIWGNGMRFRTGSASVPGFPEQADSKGGNPEGPGTDWYRFLQGAEGTMGIVTWTIAKFEYLPVFDRTCFLAFDHLEGAIEPLYRIQRRMIGNECFLLNRQAAALAFCENWPRDYEDLRRHLPPFFIALVLSGPPRLPEEKVAYEEEALYEVVAQIPSVKRVLTALPGAVSLEKRLPGLLRRPWPAEHVYWKHQLRGSCEDLFFIAKMEKVPLYTDTVLHMAARYGYPADELGMYLQPIEQGRACHVEYQFYYDPVSNADKDRLRSLIPATAEALFKQGAFFSRPYGLLAPMVFEKARGYTNTIAKIKKILDPHEILCPGNASF